MGVLLLSCRNATPTSPTTSPGSPTTTACDDDVPGTVEAGVCWTGAAASGSRSEDYVRSTGADRPWGTYGPVQCWTRYVSHPQRGEDGCVDRVQTTQRDCCGGTPMSSPLCSGSGGYVAVACGEPYVPPHFGLDALPGDPTYGSTADTGCGADTGGGSG